MMKTHSVSNMGTYNNMASYRYIPEFLSQIPVNSFVIEIIKSECGTFIKQKIEEKQN